MGRKLGILVGVLAIALSAGAAGKRVIVVMKTPSVSASSTQGMATINMAAVAEAFQQQHFNVEDTLKNVNSLVVRIENSQEIERLRKDPRVALVDEEVMLPAPKPVRGAFRRPAAEIMSSVEASRVVAGTPWGIKAVKAVEAWNVAKQGQGARVMILDTGIDRDHPSLKANFEKGQNFFPDAAKPYDYADSVGHGSHVAGTIAAVSDSGGFTGVAPSAKILMGRVCGEDGCSSVSIAQGINWGISEHVDVISMSLGGATSPPAVRAAISKAEAGGVVVVAASGNDGTNNVGYPAALATVIAVGAMDVKLKRASFSQYGPELDIVAPGVDVTSSVPQGSGRESVVTMKIASNSAVEINNAMIEGAGDLVGDMEGDVAHVAFGSAADFSKVSAKGKLVLAGRGGNVKVMDKIKSAMAAGAKAIVIYNNEPGVIRGAVNPSDGINIPVFIIEQTDGLKMAKSLDGGEKVAMKLGVKASDYASMDGTSMATPHVAGVVALIRATNKNLTPAEVRDLIKKTAQPLAGTVNNEVGAGLIDAAAAVSSAAVTHISSIR